MRRRIALVAVGTVSLLLAISLALLGRAVLDTPRALARDSTILPANARVGSARTLPERAAARLLATNRVEGFLDIVRTYRRLMDEPVLAGTAENPLSLARLIPQIHSAEERAQAHLMVGAILALPAGNGSVGFDLVRQAGQGRLLDQAMEEFRAAAKLDPANEDAKYDLELILKRQAQLQRQSRLSPRQKGQKSGKHQKIKQQRSGQRSRNRSHRHDIQQNTAGLYEPGSGY